MRGNAVRCLLMVVVWVLVSTPTVLGGPMSTEITISAANLDECLPDVAYNSVRNEYFVVWHTQPAASAWSVIGRRYSATGTFIGEYVISRRSDPRMDSMHASVAYDPGNDRYLVVWTCDYSEDGTFFLVFASFVNGDGSSPSPGGFFLRSANEKMFYPRVAFGATAQEFMVTWWTQGSGTTRDAIWANTVEADVSTMGTAFLVSGGADDRNYPDIAYNQARNEYIIVYQKAGTGNGDIYGVRLAGGGTILGGGDFGIAGWPDAEGAPRISASRVSNIWAVAWHSEILPADRDVYSRLLWVDSVGDIQMSSPNLIQGSTGDEVNPDVSAYPEKSTFLITSSDQYANGYLGIGARSLRASNTVGRYIGIRGGYDGFSGLSATAGGKNGWMVVWQQDRDTVPTYRDIHARIYFTDIMKDGFESSDTQEWSSTVP